MTCDKTAELDEANDSLTSAKVALKAESARADEAESERDEALADLEQATAKGEVPSFVGDDIDAVEGSEAVEQFGWEITTSREPSDEPPGTIIRQSVNPGTTLKRGKRIAVVIAEKPPRQWTTIFEESGSGRSAPTSSASRPASPASPTRSPATPTRS